VPSYVGGVDSEQWEAFSLHGLAEIAAEKQRTYEKLDRGEGDSNDHYDAIEDLDRKSVTQAMLMPSFSEMVSRASKFVDNPLIDQTTWVSPKLWTPDRQAIERIHLQETAGAILAEISTRKRELADLKWQELEEIVAELLRSKGMEISLVRENPQGGRDIIARAELVPGSEVVTIAVEVKHRRVVDRPILQQAIAQNKHFPALMLVTSGRFTAGVIKEAAKAENRLRVFLKDGIAIRDLAKVYQL
jgi:HJR/Mrr/RecB family endonuclease